MIIKSFWATVSVLAMWKSVSPFRPRGHNVGNEVIYHVQCLELEPRWTHMLCLTDDINLTGTDTFISLFTDYK